MMMMMMRMRRMMMMTTTTRMMMMMMVLMIMNRLYSCMQLPALCSFGSYGGARSPAQRSAV
jgi:hypothetical protein